jgi:hypothetical protein
MYTCFEMGYDCSGSYVRIRATLSTKNVYSQLKKEKNEKNEKETYIAKLTKNSLKGIEFLTPKILVWVMFEHFGTF